MLITDAQVHLWDAPTPDKPLLVERSTPQRPGGFDGNDMVREMEVAGVDRAVIVPPGWAPDGDAQAQRYAGQFPGRFAVMGRPDLNEPDWRERLETWMQQPHMIGVRMSFTGPYWTQWLDLPELDDFWSRCERLHIPAMVLLPGMAKRFEPIAAKHPGVTLVIDHMARLVPWGGPERWEDIDDLVALAKYPNLYLKASSAPNYSLDPYPYQDIQGHLKRLIDAFTPQRTMWGSDITRLRGSYKECVDLFREALGLSDSDKEWVLGKTLATALNWPEA